MNYYIESRNTDPSYNLALEQYVFDFLDRRHSFFMLWQNDNSIIVGKNQNTMAEINTEFVNTNNINVVRRLSGGGAVYHDLGNLNFTFITDSEKDKVIDFGTFCQPIQKVLVSFGVPAEISGRNDMTIEGKKFSGNAQYVKQGRVMHHGTLLYDSNLDMLSGALNASADKIESKGIKSVKSRVTNIRPYMKIDMLVDGFWRALKEHLFTAFDMKEYVLSDEDETGINKLRDNVYAQWNWNYGASPPYNICKTRRIEGCGKIEILLDVEKEGIIKNITFYGDFFGNDDTSGLSAILKGCHFEYNELARVIKEIDIPHFFHALDAQTFLNLLFE